jgi:hypothetical protein
MKRFVVDGNFTAHHMNMRQPELDIFLSDGLGYIVTEREYQAHLASATESKEVSWLICIVSNILNVRRGLLVVTIERSMQQTQTEVISEPQGWAPQLVLAMVVLFPIV